MLQLPAPFLLTLKNANTFAGANNGTWVPDGTYSLPYTSIPSAVAVTPTGGTIVLNGGVAGVQQYYPPQTITAPVTLTAFPDRPVLIGN